LRALGCAAVVALVIWALQRLNWGAVIDALKTADWRYVAATAVLNLFHIGCKSERWRIMLRRFAVVPSLKLYHYLLVSFAASIVLPARAGEALRPLVLKQRHGVPVSASIGVIAVEKLFELLGLLAIAAPLPFVLPLPTWARTSIGVLAGAGIGATIVAMVLARRYATHAHAITPTASLLERFGTGLECVRRPVDFAICLFWSLASHVIDMFELWFILCAVGLHVSPWTAAFALFTLNIAIAVPSTPGQVGALEGGAVLGLQAVGVAPEQALACAILYHATQVVPILVLGLSGIGLLRGLRGVPNVADEVAS
jgi:uncharacterized membrane protein YbhN (UPF0104 family)